MDASRTNLIDIEVDVADIQSINSADALIAFFARLGYNTDARHKQTPANLGITAEGTIRPIKKIELLAEQEGLLHIYLFELSSVTTSHTRALVRAFRNRTGNYLLILTSDYEKIDFVLVEKYVPPDIQGPGQQQVGVRPRTITVERRKPSRIHLRVLRRFTYTESDPFKQYDKLLSAYTIADWSEEFFNNRALFSDYYLLNRLQEHPVWEEDPKPAFKALREIFYEARSTWAGKSESELRKGLLEPIFSTLGFKAVAVKSPKDSSSRPDYKLYGLNENNHPLAVCLTYPWERSLDGKDDERDKDTPNENPGAAVVSLLERKEAPWAIVTNGKVWRLYSAKSHSRATNYYEMDLDEILAQRGPQANDPAESFRYFWLLFRKQAFEPAKFLYKGETRVAPFLDHLLSESYDYAKELGERLKDRVFEEVFPHLASGFIEHLHQEEGKDVHLHQEVLDQIFQGALTLLYRLLFVLYAEARDLLPVREARGYWEISLTKLKNEIADKAGNILDETEKNLKKHYKSDCYELYDRLIKLFHVIDKGNSDFNVPVYNGGLFLSEPEDNDLTPEAENARFLLQHKVPDLFLTRGIDLITRDLDTKRQDLVFIDYKSLGVRQLGSIYEGLLEFKLRVAKEKMAIVKGEKAEEIVPYKEAKSNGLKIPTEGRGNNAKERTIQKGALYLENDKRERRATGSYYTPDYIVEYIVENAVGPVLKEKFEAIAPKFREAQKAYRDAVQRNKTLLQKGMRGDNPEKVADTYRYVVDELFDIKVLDPAMGSGHFLVEAVDSITDKMLDFLNGFPWNPVFAQLQDTRDTILREMDAQGITIDPSRLTQVNLLKRYVLKRCIYGVDLNPMAVELAKVSLWLDCFTLGAPLSFLDHHLKCGNSLIGTTVEQVRKEVEEAGVHSQLSLFRSRFTGLLLATDLMRKVGELSDITSAQVNKSRIEYRKAMDALSLFKRMLDVYTSQWFGNEPQTEGRGKKRSTINPVVDLLKGEHAEKLDREEKLESLPEPEKQIVHKALEASKEKRFFHWELEFPEVFYGPQEGTKRVIKRKENPGFDVVVGNPPYDVLAGEELSYDITSELAFYTATPIYEPAIRGKKNLYKLFICRGVAITRKEGTFSFIVPMALLGDDQASCVRRLLLENTGLLAVEVFPQKDDPYNRVFPEAKYATTVFVTRVRPLGIRFAIRTHPGRHIEEKSSILLVSAQEILKFDPNNVTIPFCTQRDWEIASKIIGNEKLKTARDYCHSFQGEVNETTDTEKGFISKNPQDGLPQILRGSNICLYTLREASQGEALYLRKEKYLKGKPDNVKAYHHKQRRIGFQRKAPQNNFRRLIAAPLPKDVFCFDSVSYVTEDSCQIDIDLFLILFNSRILDWYFRLSSTNSTVNEYQFNILPVPNILENSQNIKYQALLKTGHWINLVNLLCSACTEPGVMPKPVAEALAEMCRQIQEIESKRVLKSRSERSHLAPESQPIQDAIDRVLFHYYGLTEDDACYIERRLAEML